MSDAIESDVLCKYRCPTHTSSHPKDCPFGHIESESHELQKLPAGICVNHLLGKCNATVTNCKCEKGYHPATKDMKDIDTYRKTVASAGGDIDKKPVATGSATSNGPKRCTTKKSTRKLSGKLKRRSTSKPTGKGHGSKVTKKKSTKGAAADKEDGETVKVTKKTKTTKKEVHPKKGEEGGICLCCVIL